VEWNNDSRVSRLLVQSTYFGLSSDANLDTRQTTGRRGHYVLPKLSCFIMDGEILR
jgi:hypothetical protein